MEESDYLSLPPHKGVARWSTVNLFPHWCNGNYGEVCPVHRELLRSAVLDLSPIISATACHQRNYVERYSRYRARLTAAKVIAEVLLS